MKTLFKKLFVAGLMFIAPAVLNATSETDGVIRIKRDRDLLQLSDGQRFFRQAAQLPDLVPVQINEHVSVMSAKIGATDFICIRDTRKKTDAAFSHLGDISTDYYKRLTNWEDKPCLQKVYLNRFFEVPTFEDLKGYRPLYSTPRELSTVYPDCGDILMERTVSAFPQQAFMSVDEARSQLAAKQAAADAQRAAERQAQRDAFNRSQAAERAAIQAGVDAERTRQEEARSHQEPPQPQGPPAAAAKTSEDEEDAASVQGQNLTQYTQEKAKGAQRREKTDADSARKKEEQRKADEKRLAAEKKAQAEQEDKLKAAQQKVKAEQEEAEQQAKSWSNNKFTHPYTLIAAGLGISSLAFIKYYWNECAQYQADKEAAIHPEKFPSFSTYFLNRLATTFNVSKAVFVSAAVVAGYGFYKNLNG